MEKAAAEQALAKKFPRPELHEVYAKMFADDAPAVKAAEERAATNIAAAKAAAEKAAADGRRSALDDLYDEALAERTDLDDILYKEVVETESD